LRECRTPNKNSESTETHPFFPFSASPTHYELVMKLRNQSFFLTCLYPGPDESERFPTDHHSKGKESLLVRGKPTIQRMPWSLNGLSLEVLLLDLAGKRALLTNFDVLEG